LSQEKEWSLGVPICRLKMAEQSFLKRIWAHAPDGVMSRLTAESVSNIRFTDAEIEDAVAQVNESLKRTNCKATTRRLLALKDRLLEAG
jgi:hypothetical protein